jgi:hypothetical protein
MFRSAKDKIEGLGRKREQKKRNRESDTDLKKLTEKRNDGTVR